MEGSYNPEAAHRPPPMQGLRGPRGYKQFKNPPQPHMCIQDFIRGTSEKLYINVMSWKQIGNTRPAADLIPLYGGMQIPHGCTPNCNRPPLIVFAVMVNPEILKANGKNASNPDERDALVNLLCDFVEAMNPGLHLARQPIVLKDRDLAGELKDVWHAVQAHREKEKIRNQEANSDVTHKIYHIDGPAERDPNAPSHNTQPSESENNINNINENKNVHGYANHCNDNQSNELNCIQVVESINESINNHIQRSTVNALQNNQNTKPTTSLDAKITNNTIIPPDCTSPKFDKLKQPTSNTRQISSRLNSKKKNCVKEKYLDQCESPPLQCDSIDNSEIINTPDNDDIPFADEFQNTDIACNKNELGDQLHKLTISPNSVQTKNIDSSLNTFNDRMKVSLPSQ